MTASKMVTADDFFEVADLTGLPDHRYLNLTLNLAFAAGRVDINPLVSSSVSYYLLPHISYALSFWSRAQTMVDTNLVSFILESLERYLEGLEQKFTGQFATSFIKAIMLGAAEKSDDRLVVAYLEFLEQLTPHSVDFTFSVSALVQKLYIRYPEPISALLLDHIQSEAEPCKWVSYLYMILTSLVTMRHVACVLGCGPAIINKGAMEEAIIAKVDITSALNEHGTGKSCDNLSLFKMNVRCC